MASSAVWKGVKFWLMLLLAAYVAAAVTWLLVRGGPFGTRSDAQPQQAHIRDNASGVAGETQGCAAGSAPTSPLQAGVWSARLEVARKDLEATATTFGVPEPSQWVEWICEGMVADLTRVLKRDDISRGKAACLAELEWVLLDLSARLRAVKVEDLDLRVASYQLAKLPPRTVPEMAWWTALLGTRGDDARAMLARIQAGWLTTDAGQDDPLVRRQQGFTAFVRDVQRDLPFRRYDFFRTVEEAAAKRWFAQGELLALRAANTAADQLDTYAARYEADHTFRAVENVRARLFADGRLEGSFQRSLTVGPYLMVYLSDRNLGPDTYVGFAPKSAGARVASAGDIRRIDALLYARGRVYQAVDKAFRQRFASDLGLKSLTQRWGGRPDYPIGVRSYADGVVSLVILVDGNSDWWRQDTRRDKSAYIFESDGLMPELIRSDEYALGGSVIVVEAEGHDESPARREVLWAAHAWAAAQQLWYWSARQRNNWRQPQDTHPFTVAVLASMFDGIRVEADGAIRMGRHNGRQLERLRQLSRPFVLNEKSPPWVTLDELLAVSGTLPGWKSTKPKRPVAAYLHRPRKWAERWKTPSDESLFRIHASGFARWIAEDPERKTRFVHWLNLQLDGAEGHEIRTLFMEVFRPSVDGDANRYQRSFEVAMADMLKEPVGPWRTTPPPAGEVK